MQTGKTSRLGYVYFVFCCRPSIIDRVKPNVKRTWVPESDLFIGLLVFFAALVLYLKTIPPTVLDGDSGEYEYMAYILGVPHNPGSPLYILLGKLFTFLPIGNVAYRVNLSSAAFAALAAPVVYWCGRRLTESRPAALLATLIFVVSPSMWGSAVETKTYALHLFLGVLATLFLVRWLQQGRKSDWYWLAFVYGLGLTNHPMIRFMAPALVLAVWLNRKRLDRSAFIKGAVLGVMPLLLYAYVPIRANQLIAQQDPANWALYTREDAILKGTVSAYYNNTPSGVFNFITGLDNLFKLEIKPPSESGRRFDLSGSLLLQQFGIVGIALAVVGAVLCFRRDRNISLVLLLLAGGIGFFALYLHAISTVFYFSLMYFVLALWVALGIEVLLGWAARIRSAAKSRMVAALASPQLVVPVLALVPLGGLASSYAGMDQSQNYEARDYAQTVLHEKLAQNAVVLAPWEVSQPIRYFQFVENQRPDLLVVNMTPVYEKQFNTLLKNAHDLQRPIYLVEFNPEEKMDSSERYVRVVPLPLLAEPQPRHPLQGAQLADGVQVLGFDLDPDPPLAALPTRISIYYRAPQRMYPMYSATLSVTDNLGRPWKDYHGFPAAAGFPTYRWYEMGQYYRDTWSVLLPPEAPSGLYNLDLSWNVYDLETRKSDPGKEYKVALGTIHFGDISVQAQHPVAARAGDAITFLGWSSLPAAESETVTVQRGDKLALDLFWRSDQAAANSYTVFVHLAAADGHVLANADSPPSGGLMPTDHWEPGESIRDRHVLTIPKDLSAGEYVIEIGLYLPSTGQRLGINVASQIQDKLILTHVRVK